MSVLEKRKAARGAESKRRGANKMWLLLEEPVTMAIASDFGASHRASCSRTLPNEPAHIEKRRLDARVTIMVEREMPDGKVETTSKTVVGKEAEKIIERRFPPRFLGW